MSRDSVEKSRDADAHRAVAAQVGRLAAEGRWGADVVPDKPWLIKDVPEHTRREVKVYAAARGITVAEALEEIVSGYLQLAAAEGADQAETASAAIERETEKP